MQKILFISKLFSGFESIIKNENFEPTGAPTVYKIIEKLDLEYDLKLILTCKNDLENKSLDRFNVLKIKGLKNKLLIFGSLKFKFISSIIREIVHFILILLVVLFWRPNLIYFGNANIISAALITRLLKKKVIFRLMGVYEVMRTYHLKSNFKNKFYLWCYKSEFNAIICTQDGSGIESWIEQTLNSNSEIFKLINGVDHPIKYFHNHKEINKLKILFIGRLEKDKGILEFLEVVDYFEKNEKIFFEFTIVGTGILEKKTIEFIDGIKKVKIQYLAMIPHKDIKDVFNQNDIYISLNKRGSLSNTTIEAMSNGLMCFCLSSNPQNGIDVFTDKFLSKNLVTRINRKNIKDDLIYNLNNFDKKKLSDIKNLTYSFAKNNIPTWDKRIQDELNIINNLFR